MQVVDPVYRCAKILQQVKVRELKQQKHQNARELNKLEKK